MFQSGDELSSSLAEPFLDALIFEEDEPLLAQVFNLWHEKGVTENEIYYVAKIMRGRCTRVNSCPAYTLSYVPWAADIRS